MRGGAAAGAAAGGATENSAATLIQTLTRRRQAGGRTAQIAQDLSTGVRPAGPAGQARIDNARSYLSRPGNVPPSNPKPPKTVPKNKAGLMAAGVGAAALLGYSALKDKATSGKKEGVEALLIKNKEKLEAKEKENTKKMQSGGIAVIAGLSCSMAALGGIMLMFASKK